jgi:SagB-type dehydrogenase family enzyme
MASGDRRQALAQAALNQDCVRTGAAVLVLAALYERTTRKYGERGIRYVHIEIGHVAQNVYLQAVALGLGTVMVGAFDDEEVKAVLGLEKDEQPLGLMPIGRLP